MKNEFVWTDDLVMEFAEKKLDNWLAKTNIVQIDEFKKSKEPKLDYEILQVNDPIDNSWSTTPKSFDSLLKSGWVIEKVKRLSDNEVFTIGDMIEAGNTKCEIYSFELNRPSVPQSITIHAGGRIWHFNYAKKSKNKEELFEVKLTKSELYKLMQLINGQDTI